MHTTLSSRAAQSALLTDCYELSLMSAHYELGSGLDLIDALDLTPT